MRLLYPEEHPKFVKMFPACGTKELTRLNPGSIEFAKVGGLCNTVPTNVKVAVALAL